MVSCTIIRRQLRSDKTSFAFALGQVFRASVANPLPGQSVAEGTMGRLNDAGDVVAVHGDLEEMAPILVHFDFYPEVGSRVFTGSWADINFRQEGKGPQQRIVVFEALDDEGRRRLYTRRLLQGIDASRDLNWNAIVQRFDPKFFIQAAWSGIRPFDAERRLEAAPLGIPKAAYALLNFRDTPALNGTYQIGRALQAVGEQVYQLKFMAIDVELPPTDPKLRRFHMPTAPVERIVQRIAEAVEAVEAAGLRPIIYTRRSDWNTLTNNTTRFSHLPLWDVRAAAACAPSQWDDDLDRDFGQPWEPYGGWDRRMGRQYKLDDVQCIGANVDLNVFDPSLFLDRLLPAPRPERPTKDGESAPEIPDFGWFALASAPQRVLPDVLSFRPPDHASPPAREPAPSTARDDSVNTLARRVIASDARSLHTDLEIRNFVFGLSVRW